MTDRDDTTATVGTVSGPGSGPNEFVFVTPDGQDVRTGEFVTYTVAVEGTERDVIARVTDREMARGLPESFMTDPAVTPETVASTLGVPTDDVDLYRLRATVVGYYDTAMATFSNPRQLPPPGTPVRIAPDGMLESVLPNLGLSATGSDPAALEGLAEVGWLLNRPDGATTIRLPIDTVASTHLAILASTGSGKSYTASVLLEEMMKPGSRGAILVFDPHGEYETLAEIQGQDEFFGRDGYEPEVEYFDPDRLRVRISELSLGDVVAVLDNPSERMEQRLGSAWSSLQQQQSRTWGVDELVAEMREQFGDDDTSVGALEWRLEVSLGSNDLFQPDANVPLDDLVAPGRCTVLQMDTLDRHDQQMIATVLLRRLYQARLIAMRGRDSPVNFPLFALFEEGHRFAPSSGSAPSLGIIRTITSEGRKFGFGVGVVSQRPSKIDQDTLSQCGTQVIMQIQNPADLQAIRQSVESAGESVIDELPGLTPGQAVISGDAMNTTVLARIRKRHTAHGADSLETTQAWREAVEENNRAPSRSEAADFAGGDSTGPEQL